MREGATPPPPPTLTQSTRELLERLPSLHDVQEVGAALWEARRDDAFIAWVAEHLGPLLMRYFGAEVFGLERWPEGPALCVGNHSGGLLSPDSFVFGAALVKEHGVEEIPFALGHDVVLDAPALGWLLRKLGAVPANHGGAHACFAADRKVLVYPGGDVDAMRPSRLRHQICFGGRKGYVRLALREGVPLVPIVAAGAHSGFYLFGDLAPLLRLVGLAQLFRLKTWPMGVSIPWGFTLGPPPPYFPPPTRILIEVMEPIVFGRQGPEAAEDAAYVEACDRMVRARMQSVMDRLVQERRRRGRWAHTDWQR